MLEQSREIRAFRLNNSATKDGLGSFTQQLLLCDPLWPLLQMCCHGEHPSRLQARLRRDVLLANRRQLETHFRTEAATLRW